MTSRNGSLDKSLRLILLLRMQEAGELDGLTLQQIADRLPGAVDKSTISRDLRSLKKLNAMIAELRKK